MKRLLLLALTYCLFILPQQAMAFCFEQAGQEVGLAPELLRAVAKVESSLNPNAMNMSHVARTGSWDIGLMQINSRMAKTYGVTQQQLVEQPCTNVKIGARILKSTCGNNVTWECIGKYNAACTQLKGQACFNARATYAWKVFRALKGGLEDGAQKRGKAMLASVQHSVHNGSQGWATTIDVGMAESNSPHSEDIVSAE